MKRLLISLLAALLLASCGIRPTDSEPVARAFPPPEGLFIVYEINADGSAGHYGLVNALGEVVLPMQYSMVDHPQFFDGEKMAADVPAGQRFFLATQPLEAGGSVDRPLYWALLSPEGSFLTGFDYLEITLLPGDPVGILARRADSPEQLLYVDQNGEERPVEDEELLFRVSHQRWVWEGEAAERAGPDVPDQGFDWTLETRSGNYWGGVILPDFTQEVRLFSPLGVLISPDIYHNVWYIGDGFYQASRLDDASWESFIVDQTGRRLAGPYESFFRHPNSSFILGMIGENAHIMTVDNFQEIRTVALGWDWSLAGNAAHPVLALSSPGTPLTLIRLDSGEEIVFHDFFGYSLIRHNHDLTRFVLADLNEEHLPDAPQQRQKLVDREGNILAQADAFANSSYLFDWGEILVAAEYSGFPQEKNRLINWDGEILLEGGLSHIEPLPGNALRVTRGGTTGIMDLGGDWIFIQPTVAG